MKKFLMPFLLAFLFIASVSVPLFVGCSGNSDSNTGGNGGVPTLPDIPDPDPVFNAVLCGARLSWDEIANVDSFILVYTFESFDEDIDDIENEVKLLDPAYLVTYGAGIITYTIIANFEDGDYFESTEHIGIITEFSVLEAALENLSTHRAVSITSRGVSTASSLTVSLNLTVGADHIINFNEDGSVYEAYKRVMSHATGSGAGSGIAVAAANRSDRLYFNTEADQIHNQTVGGWGSGSTPNIPINSALETNWGVRDENNTRHEPVTLEQWTEGYLTTPGITQHKFIAPYVMFGYIVNEDTISEISVSLEFEDGEFKFTFVMYAVEATASNRYEVMRSGGIPFANYQLLTLEFVIDEDMNFVSYRSISRYSAGAPPSAPLEVPATTNVNTLYVFEFFDEIQEMPWMGEFCDEDEREVAEQGQACVATGTMITLADGSLIAIEALVPGDMLKVWNFTTGNFDVAPIMFIDSDVHGLHRVLRLEFSDGTFVKTIYAHGFFNTTLNRYVRVTEENAHTFIGDSFKSDAGSVRLVSVESYFYQTATFNPVVAGHLSFFANGMLTAPGAIIRGGFANIFQINPETLAYCEEYRAKMIYTFDLLTFEQFSNIINIPQFGETMFNAFNGQYLNISVGKGLATWCGITAMIVQYLSMLN